MSPKEGSYISEHFAHDELPKISVNEGQGFHRFSILKQTARTAIVTMEMMVDITLPARGTCAGTPMLPS
jgi:hypothetical protein